VPSTPEQPLSALLTTCVVANQSLRPCFDTRARLHTVRVPGDLTGKAVNTSHVSIYRLRDTTRDDLGVFDPPPEHRPDDVISSRRALIGALAAVVEVVALRP
jgi:hypothetical protein